MTSSKIHKGSRTKVSIIVPTYNEEQTLAGKKDNFRRLSELSELIFVDGGSSDMTSKYARQYGKFIKSPKGRAIQMNTGAQVARQDILLFLHADTFFPPENLKFIDIYAREKGYVGGCFSQKIDRPDLIFQWIAWTGNIRAKAFKIFYGDQGIFVMKDVFKRLGGFPQVPICEDILFSKKLNKVAKVGILPYTINSSARRWAQQGILKTFIVNMRVVLGLRLGYDLERLAKIYQDVRSGRK